MNIARFSLPVLCGSPAALSSLANNPLRPVSSLPRNSTESEALTTKSLAELLLMVATAIGPPSATTFFDLILLVRELVCANEGERDRKPQ